MQIDLPSVAADRQGFVFNCDGQYALDTTSGAAQAGNEAGVQCIYANYIDGANANYAGHTQLARVQSPATGNDQDLPKSTNATFVTLSSGDITVLPVSAIEKLGQCFAGGPGQVHIYGLNQPYQLYL